MEIWQTTLVSDTYLISSMGNVKVLRGTLKRPFLLTSTLHKGYKRLRIANKMYRVHRLVAEVFLDNPECKPFVNHKNGIKSDNRVENLEWVTHQENIVHAVKSGLKVHQSGCENGNAKLTSDQIKQIRHSRSGNGELKDLAKRLGVHYTTVYQIRKRQRYVNVE